VLRISRTPQLVSQVLRDVTVRHPELDPLDRLFQSVRDITVANHMDAYVVGSIDPLGECDDRLLKICPVGIRINVLVEVELDGQSTKLYRHRTSALTKRHKGSVVSAEWLKDFIASNRDRAIEIIRRNDFGIALPEAPEDPMEKPSPEESKGQDDPVALRGRRLTISCSCRGEVERCTRCYGSGKYVVDGYGNTV